MGDEILYQLATGVGHNLPEFRPAEIVDLEILPDQLRATYAHLFAIRDQYFTTMADWAAAHPAGIADDDDMRDATDRAAQLATVLDSWHGKKGCVHEAAKEPFLKGGRIVDTVLNTELTGQLRSLLDGMKSQMLAYARQQAEKQRREAQQAAQKAAEAAAAAKPQATLDEALAAEQAALDAIAAAADVKPVLHRGDLGTSAGLRGTWRARIKNVDLVPRAFMVPDLGMIEARMKATADRKTRRPTIEIPGVEFYEEFGLAVRK